MTGDYYRQLNYRQQQQQAMQSGTAILVDNLLGWGQYANTYANTVGCYQANTTTAAAPQGLLQGVQKMCKKLHFFRINEKVEVSEGEEIKNPVDRLRLKAARWLEEGRYSTSIG